MTLAYDPDAGQKWYAVTDDGGYDAVGASPIDAVTALVLVLENELEIRK